MGTPVTSLELKEILEGMARIFQEKIEKGTSSKVGGSVLDSLQTVQKIDLLPIDVKLEGTRNYLSWSRRALLNLQMKGLEKYVTTDCEPAAKEETPEWQIWKNTNSLVMSWLLTSVSPSIARMVESIRSAAQVWEILAGMYSGAGSVMMMMEVEEQIDAILQGEKSVHQYAAELCGLWSDLDHYDPLMLKCSEDVKLAKQYVERRRVVRFLKGLNPKFEARRAAICHLPSLPSLDEVVASMEQEEIRQKFMTSDVP